MKIKIIIKENKEKFKWPSVTDPHIQAVRLKKAYAHIRTQSGLDFVPTFDLARAANLSADDFKAAVGSLMTRKEVSLSGENQAIVKPIDKPFGIDVNGRKFFLIMIKQNP